MLLQQSMPVLKMAYFFTKLTKKESAQNENSLSSLKDSRIISLESERMFLNGTLDDLIEDSTNLRNLFEFLNLKIE